MDGDGRGGTPLLRIVLGFAQNEFHALRLYWIRRRGVPPLPPPSSIVLAVTKTLGELSAGRSSSSESFSLEFKFRV